MKGYERVITEKVVIFTESEFKDKQCGNFLFKTYRKKLHEGTKKPLNHYYRPKGVENMWDTLMFNGGRNRIM